MNRPLFITIDDITDVNDLFNEFCKIIELHPNIVKRAFLHLPGTEAELKRHVVSADELFGMISEHGERWKMSMTMRLDYWQNGYTEEEMKELRKKFSDLVPPQEPITKIYRDMKEQEAMIKPELRMESKVQEVPAPTKLDTFIDPDFLD